ncbi:hypothetical protein QLT28_00300 [Streptococcus equi subsp. zooepidemicus]|uniref:hypothetical protein n=1 Tax=Streptococcus equi TaxID=1336 RepID=UPI0024A8046B|nr:hypothetical protein [Streptococcus equi]MDI5913450.1 hypothetical protein [Streptococcus equi subsp. zooepidemicus]
MAQDFGDDVGEMLFRFMERNAENLMQEYAKTLVHQTVLGWYQARAERMGLSKEETAYLAKAMANKEQACVPFGNKNDAAYFAQVCKENDVFAAALSDGNDNGYIVFVKDDLKKLQDCVPQFSEVMTTLKNREIAELLAKGKPLPNKPPKGFKLVKNMPDLPHTENTREPDRDTRNTPPVKDSIGETPTSNHSEQVVHDLANDPYNHTALICDKVLAAREQCRDLEDFKAILAENGIGTRLNDDGELQFYEGRQGENGEMLEFDKSMDWPVNAKTLAGDKYHCDATLDWFEKNTPKEPSGIDRADVHAPIPPQKDLNLICNAVRSDLEERGIETRDRPDGKMGFVVDQKYKQDVIKAVEARFPGLMPEELGIEFDNGRNDPPNPPTPPVIDGSLDTDGRTPSLDQNIKSHDSMDTATNTARMEKDGSNTDVSPTTVREQSDRSREKYDLNSQAKECRAASKQLSQTNDSPDRDISDQFQQER